MAYYVPGYGAASVTFMAARTAATHAAFFLPHLWPGLNLLDLGCGPGSITVGLAEAVAPGRVIGLDRDASQVAAAERAAASAGLGNATFRQAEADALDVADESVDRVFAHALLEHVPDPAETLREARRVLRPGGRIGLASPDWGGFLLAPPDDGVTAACAAYEDLHRANGGDPALGRRLGELLAAAGFVDVRLDARYERYLAPGRIADYLARQLEAAGAAEDGAALRRWSAQPRAMFAQAWVSAVAVAPDAW